MQLFSHNICQFCGCSIAVGLAEYVVCSLTLQVDENNEEQRRSREDAREARHVDDSRRLRLGESQY